MTTKLEALAQLTRQDPTLEYFAAFHNEVNSEKNDRGAAILLAANVETTLRYAIQRELNSPKSDFKRLFHHDAPIGTFEAKIRIGKALGIFGNEMKGNLDCIKAIRNAFAHAVIPISFETVQVKDVCDLLVMPTILPPHTVKASTGEPTGAMPPNPTPRQRFQKVCEATSHNLYVRGWIILPSAERHPPSEMRATSAKPPPLP